MSIYEVFGVQEGEGGPADIAVDVELFIRMLEWAREESKTDMELHKFAENAERLTAEKGELSMADYQSLLSGVMEADPDAG